LRAATTPAGFGLCQMLRPKTTPTPPPATEPCTTLSAASMVSIRVPPESPPGNAVSDREHRPTLLVGTIEMPQTLDRPQFVRRSGTNTVELAELDRWSEPLDGMIRRSLADDLAARLPKARVLTSVLPSVPIDHTLMLEIDRFEAASGGTVKLNARQGRDLAHCAPERET